MMTDTFSSSHEILKVAMGQSKVPLRYALYIATSVTQNWLSERQENNWSPNICLVVHVHSEGAFTSESVRPVPIRISVQRNKQAFNNLSIWKAWYIAPATILLGWLTYTQQHYYFTFLRKQQEHRKDRLSVQVKENICRNVGIYNIVILTQEACSVLFPQVNLSSPSS